MKISVVIPCYNYEDFVGQAIESVLAGDRPPDEVIVVDDGSVDGSAEVARRYPEVKLVQKANGGMASALNAGIAEAVGDVVVLLDADDLAAPGRLAWVESAFMDPTVAMAWHPLRIESSTSRSRLLLPSTPLPDGDIAGQVAARGLESFAITSGIAARRTALAALGAIPEEQFRLSSEGYLVRTLPFAGRIAATREPLGIYRSHAGSQVRAMAAHDVPSVGKKLGDLLHVADAEQELLAASAVAAGHPVTVDRLRAMDSTYLDYQRWHARLVAPSRREGWRRFRDLSVDFPRRLTHRRIRRLLAGVWSTILSKRVAKVSFLIRHDLELTGSVKQLARVYWFHRALVAGGLERLRGERR